MNSDQILKKVLIIGISGVTSGGKTTLANKLKEILSKSIVFSQDDYFRDINDPMHVWIPELNHINFDILSSLDMEKMYGDILKFIKAKNLSPISNEQVALQKKVTLNHTVELLNKINSWDIHILIIEGFSIFNFKKWLYLFNLMYYVTLNKEECYKRRIKRVYDPPDCLGYFEQYVWPEYIKQKKEVKDTVPNVKFVDNMDKDYFKVIVNDTFHVLNHRM